MEIDIYYLCRIFATFWRVFWWHEQGKTMKTIKEQKQILINRVEKLLLATEVENEELRNEMMREILKICSSSIQEDLLCPGD